MDLYDFVWTSFPDRTKWLNGGEGDQGAVLAFDLNVSSECNPPDPGKYAHEWVLGANESSTASGPWCAGITKISKKNYRHSEEQLMGNLGNYIGRYREAHGSYPKSVSLYTYFGPCASCVEIMRRAARDFGDQIPLWYLYFDHPHVKSVQEQLVPSSKSRKKGKYQDFDAHLRSLNTFTKWQVMT